MTGPRMILGIVSVAMLATPALTAQATLSCEAWNTEAFFETATPEDVTACLDAGAAPMAPDADGITPLHWAVWSNETPAVVEVLLAAGADLEARNNNDRTALHNAAGMNENPAVVEVLLAPGPTWRRGMIVALSPCIAQLRSPRVQPFWRRYWQPGPIWRREMLMAERPCIGQPGGTRIWRCWRPCSRPEPTRWRGMLLAKRLCIEHSPRMRSRLLLAAGADPRARDVEGRTPLHSRASLLDSAMIAALLAAGADLEARDEDGNTPLHRAAAYGVVYGDDPDARFHAGRAIAALLDAGANAMARNAAGETAWDLAQANEALQGADGLLAPE